MDASSRSHTCKSRNQSSSVIRDEVEIREADFWIDNPIRCGYLHAFCEFEYNSENIKFLIAIDQFRDNLARY